VQAPPLDNKEVALTLAMLRWLLILIFVVTGWVVLSYLAGVLAPILAALGIAYMLNPVLDKLVKWGMSRAMGAGLLLAAFTGAIVTVVSFATPYIADQLGDFFHDLPRTIETANAWLNNNLGLEIPQDWRLSSTDVRDALGHATPMQRLGELVFAGVFGVLGVLAEVLLVPVFAFYFLVDWPNLLRRFEHMVPPRRRSTVRDLAREIDRVIANWVRGQAIVTTTLAVLYAIAFTIVGIPLSVPIGFVVGALTIIPFVGTFVGAGLTVVVTLAGGGDTRVLGAVAVVFVVLHLLEAAVLTPKIVGHRVGLSESGALLAVVAGGKLLGFVGVVLAVPIAATLAVLARYLVRYYERTHFFGHESDADIVVTPGMALIMPGTQWTPAVWEDGASHLEEQVEIALPGDEPTPAELPANLTKQDDPDRP